MQQLAVQRQLHSSQTLTALHDSVNAWSGLGSSVLTVLQQFRVPATVFPTLITSIYLGCIAVLHITTPALFSLETFNSTMPTDIKTYGMLDYSQAIGSNPNSYFA